ncbi:hypothetical protein B296_00019011 [Ensete ventricosum]|uniref:Uncharacterized protein n=1 Tax=Ensete ventricosum TaxID=4639 RepID=A0A426Z413_ENSVE|nr:hypothetical protein B296_00019011 [Ensete ventricosum]
MCPPGGASSPSNRRAQERREAKRGGPRHFGFILSLPGWWILNAHARVRFVRLPALRRHNTSLIRSKLGDSRFANRGPPCLVSYWYARVLLTRPALLHLLSEVEED